MSDMPNEPHPPAPEPAAPIDVQLIADLACPWCHLGLARLERARAQRPQLALRLRWWPFFLNPQMPPEGMDRKAYLRIKFGGEAAAARVYERIVEAGRADGVDFAFERMQRTPNTLDAHRLILFAEEHGGAETLIQQLFEALFVAGRDVGARAELLAIAEIAGLGRAEVAGLLAGEDYAKAVLGAHRRAERLGVRGVPVFVVDGEHVIAGAQPPEVLIGLLDLAATARTSAPPDAPFAQAATHLD